LLDEFGETKKEALLGRSFWGIGYGGVQVLANDEMIEEYLEHHQGWSRNNDHQNSHS